MVISQQEAIVAWSAVNLNEKGEPRTFPLSQLGDAGKIAKELRAKTSGPDDKFLEGDHDVELDTDCRKLLKDLLDRSWPVQVAEAVFSLKAKLA